MVLLPIVVMNRSSFDGCVGSSEVADREKDEGKGTDTCTKYLGSFYVCPRNDMA
jgi:hypothetical protein